MSECDATIDANNNTIAITGYEDATGRIINYVFELTSAKPKEGYLLLADPLSEHEKQLMQEVEELKEKAKSRHSDLVPLHTGRFAFKTSSAAGSDSVAERDQQDNSMPVSPKDQSRRL